MSYISFLFQIQSSADIDKVTSRREDKREPKRMPERTRAPRGTFKIFLHDSQGRGGQVGKEEAHGGVYMMSHKILLLQFQNVCRTLPACVLGVIRRPLELASGGQGFYR